MKPFKIILKNNAVVSGLAPLPSLGLEHGHQSLPLIFGILDGTYSANYFLADEQHSAIPLSVALGVPFVVVNRLGYDDSTLISCVLNRAPCDLHAFI